jgi:hypothetical protein
LEQRVSDLEVKVASLQKALASETAGRQAGDASQLASAKSYTDSQVRPVATILAPFRISSDGREVTLTAANLHIVNGSGSTHSANGLGNLIVGYNELRSGGANVRTGSHNVVVGEAHNFSSFGGLVVGLGSTISGQFSSISGGTATS